MGLITKEVEVGLGGNNVNHFEDLGYKIPRQLDKQGRLKVIRGTKIIVKVEDLPDGSKALVNVECDNCHKEINNVFWKNYKKYVKDDGRYYCITCASKLFIGEGIRKTRLLNGKSFKVWCYDNLSEELAKKVLLRWNNELNIDIDGNTLTPDDVSYGSAGLNKKGYWFNCLDNPDHKPEQKHIKDYIRGQEGSIKCHQCNTIKNTHPNLIKYFINPNDTAIYSAGSNAKVPMRCPDCGYEKELRIGKLITRGFGCQKCSFGYYPEKFLFNVFEQLLENNFKVQLNKTTFKWCGSYKYDFYINKINGICECHGKQHYVDAKGIWANSSDTQENDKLKEKLARDNGIVNYIVLNCRKSELKWIRNSIMTSILPELLNFKESDIDWLKAHEFACKTRVKEVCDLWSKGFRNVSELVTITKISRTAIRKYLKQGTELNWCIPPYDSKEESKKSQTQPKRIICLTTNEIFDSMLDAYNKYGIQKTNISACCRGKMKSAGKLEDGTKMQWMYYDKYLEKNK